MKTALIKALRAIRGETTWFSIDIISLTGNARQRAFVRKAMRWMEGSLLILSPYRETNNKLPVGQ
jgi:hypothetical protein